MKNRIISLILVTILTFSLSACFLNHEEITGAAVGESSGKWRCTFITNVNLFTQYIYDADGNVQEIIEYENQGTGAGDYDSMTVNRITFNKNGRITSVKSSESGALAEIIDGKTWHSFLNGISLTVTYNDFFMIETQIIKVGEYCKISAQNSYDNTGKQTSTTTEIEYYDGTPTSISVTRYEYGYDRYGNPIIQFTITDSGKWVSATYSWER